MGNRQAAYLRGAKNWKKPKRILNTRRRRGGKMTERNKRQELVWREEHGTNMKLADYIVMLQQKLNEIPEEHRAEAQFRSGTFYEYGESYAEAEIYYWRPETDEEMDLRLVRERKVSAQHEELERATLAKLQKKYAAARPL
jgi:hypothetical protein